MRKFLLLLILGTVCLMGYSQSRYECSEVLFTVDQTNIKVHLGVSFNNGLYDNASIYVTSVIGWHWRGWLPKTSHCFGEYTWQGENENVDSLFQHLYNWIKEIELFTNNYNRNDIKDFLKRHSSDYLIVSNGKVSIKSSIGDDPDRCTMSFEDIKNFKRQLIEYTHRNGIIIRP